MKRFSWIQKVAVLGLLTLCTFAYAAAQEAPAKDLIIQRDKIYNPDELTLDSVVTYEKNFSLDWNNYASINKNKQKMIDIETFLRTTSSSDIEKKLKPDEQNSLGVMVSKLGAYYAHINHQPDSAIEKLDSAEQWLNNRNDKAWNYGHLAYAYEQKYNLSGKKLDQEKAQNYIKKVLVLQNRQKNEIVAYAYCIRALLANDDNDYKQAIADFQTALGIYTRIGQASTMQAALAKNKLASIVAEENSKNEEAIGKLLDIKRFWGRQNDGALNPYATRNALSLGRTYLKIGKVKDRKVKDIEEVKSARNEFRYVVNVYQNIFGSESILLSKPYQFLADVYKILGNQKLADDYQIIANQLDHSEI